MNSENVKELLNEYPGLKQSSMTKKDLEDEIYTLQDNIDICYEKGWQGIIMPVGGKTEYWYIEDMQNWIEEDEFRIRNDFDDEEAM